MADDTAEVVAFHPPAVLAGFLAAGAALTAFLPVSLGLPAMVSWVVGPVTIGGAVALFVWAAGTLAAGDTGISHADRTTAIMDHGPFAISRNPIYVAMVLLQVGLGILLGSAWFVGLAIGFAVLIDRGVIQREEAFLTRHFGEAYSEYSQRVNRWL